MSAASVDRLEMRVDAELKGRVRRAAEARGVSLTRFALDALAKAANEVLDTQPDGSRCLGWAAGTAGESADIVSPATTPDEWDALRE